MTLRGYLALVIFSLGGLLYSFDVRFVVFVSLMKRLFITDALEKKETMEGLKKDTAFSLKGLETKEQFLAQNTHKLPEKELLLHKLGKHD